MTKDMRISDEMLARYLDGQASEHEMHTVLSALSSDIELRQVLTIALQVPTPQEETLDVLPMMKLAALSNENICDVQCEAYIMQRRGMSIDHRQLLATARKAGWLLPKGTPLHAIGQLLANEGLMITRQYDATIGDIEAALAVDNDVIAAVDSDKLYPGRPDPEDEPNHVVVVIAVDPAHEHVTIYDPAEPTDGIEIPMPLFLNAWHESSNYMIRVLQTIEDYTPQPVHLDDVKLTDDLQQLREAIAENAHDVWAAARINEGWSYGPERDDRNLRHPDIVPYSSLPDSEKQYDRLMALDTIKLVRKLGFDIVKRGQKTHLN